MRPRIGTIIAVSAVLKKLIIAPPQIGWDVAVSPGRKRIAPLAPRLAGVLWFSRRIAAEAREAGGTRDARGVEGSGTLIHVRTA